MKLNYSKKLITIEEIKQELVNIGPYDATMGIMMQCVMRLNEESQFLYLDLIDYREQIAKLLSNPKIAPTIKYFMEYYVRMGYYDAL